ncbi:hypothetical protein [Hymenobacter negativus]|uniref:Uncharacterized protein n=1 Tax=Hymenobacter negativus TaxID=2795026 RepID=A0ABS3Q964_9BACT|nr:hypothetical protein [Hymenobacter negativus]MBO2007797.1 hypothetical protein [Hymenobacter negativus]
MSFLRQRRGRRGRFLFFPLVAGAAALALGGVVMALWNAILPDALHAGRLNYWQGVGLLVLCRVLFGSYGRGGAGGRGHGQGHEKWQRMSDDERQQFRQQWQARARAWGGGRPPQAPPPQA